MGFLSQPLAGVRMDGAAGKACRRPNTEAALQACFKPCCEVLALSALPGLPNCVGRKHGHRVRRTLTMLAGSAAVLEAFGGASGLLWRAGPSGEATPSPQPSPLKGEGAALARIARLVAAACFFGQQANIRFRPNGGFGPNLINAIAPYRRILIRRNARLRRFDWALGRARGVWW
jgi:hypothetical protein